ncbi:MAG TPA: hypothetical protein VLV83_26510 [Acidobacteriota bacterium]|nr:hypothetical protein [Acidobacteriota bacterium]
MSVFGGPQAPDFTLPDYQGQMFSLDQFLEDGPALLVFLRHLA